PRIFLIRSNSSGVRPCCLMSSGVTAGSAVGIWLIIDRFTLTNPQVRSNHSTKNFHQIATTWKRPAAHRTTNLGYQNEGGIMVRKAIVALACVLIASPAFAQTTSKRTRYYRSTTAITSVQGVTVTAPIIASEGGSVASYQPAGTLVVRTDSANPERFDLPGPGLVYDKFGRPVTTPIKPGTRVRVFYADLGPVRTIDHVIVEQ